MRRRDLLAAAGVGLFTRPALADASPPRAFASGPLARNALAQNFEPPPRGLALPGGVTMVDAANLPRRFSELRGAPALVCLWAEWCAPCLAEAHDLATLAAHALPGVRVLSVLTASNAKLDGPAAHARLARARAEALPCWAEPEGGGRVMAAVAGGPINKGGSLPCTVIVDRKGRVRGRMLGARFISGAALFGRIDHTPDGRLTENGKRQLERQAGDSVFALPSAPALLQLLAAGALERSPA